jgi:hypothetical protein
VALGRHHDSGAARAWLAGVQGVAGRWEDELPPADVEHMRKVVGYVTRHVAQRPSGDVEHTRWRYSLMNSATTH